MGRTSRDKQLSNRVQRDYLDFTELLFNDNITETTEFIVRNVPGGKATKSSWLAMFSPILERIEALEEEKDEDTLNTDHHSSIYWIEADTEYTIDYNKQMIVKDTLIIEGILNIDGQLYIEL